MSMVTESVIMALNNNNSYLFTLRSYMWVSPFINRKSTDRDTLLTSLQFSQENETAIRPILETVDWNPEAVQGLNDYVLNSPQTYFCFGENVSCLSL